MQRLFQNAWIIIASLVIIAALSISIDTQKLESELSIMIFQAMIYYLLFIILRTAILLLISFKEFMQKKSNLELTHFPLVTIIIPCFNEEVVIKDAIKSVEKINYPNLEILVVDDGSTDETYARAREMQKTGKVRVVSKSNGGKASALNYGIEEALGEYILCMDADSHLNREVLRYGIPYFYEFPHLSALAGNVRVGNTSSLITLFQKLEYVVGLNFHKMAQSALSSVTIIPGPIGIFKRSALQSVGGYDVNTFAEDCDLTLKLLAAGHYIKYSSDVVAYTEAPTTLYQLMAQRYRWSRGTIQALVKNSRGFLTSANPTRSISIFLYVMIETMFIPTINFLFFMITIFMALYHGTDNLYGPFLLGLMLVDSSIALYAVFTEKEVKSLFFLSIIGRLTYGLFLEIMRFLSMIDELFKIPMRWGEQIRKGIK